MKKQNMLYKLEHYEKIAYDCGMGTDWLETIGEGLKFYVEDCMDTNRNITMLGFMAWIERLAIEKDFLT